MCMYVYGFTIRLRLVRLALAARVPRRHVGELAGERHVGARVAVAAPPRPQVPHTYSKSRHSWSASNRAKKNQLFMSFMREKMNGAKIRVPLCMQAFVQMSQDEYS